MFPHAEWIELAWLAAGLTGLGFTSSSLKSALADLRRAKKNDATGNPLALAHAIVTSNWMMLCVNVLIVCAATAALFLPPPPPAYREVPQSLIGIICWVAVSAVLSVQAWYGRTVRTRLFSGVYERRSPRT